MKLDAFVVLVACQQVVNKDVFVNAFPVQPVAADAAFVALRWCGVEQAGEPREGHAKGASVMQLNPERVFVKVDVFSGSIHPISFQFRHGALR